MRKEQLNGTFIHPIDAPQSKVYQEQPSRVPSFKVDILAPVVFYGVISFAFFYFVYVDFWPGWAAAVVCTAVLHWRVTKVLGDPIAIIKETFFQPVQVSQAAPGRTAPLFVHGQPTGEIEITRNPKTLRGPKGDYIFSGHQLDTLEKIVNDPDGDGKVRRETSGLGRGLAEIGVSTGQYPIVYAALKEKGYIGQDDKWTDLGLRWVKAK